MGSYLDNLVTLLANAREELHVPDLTEEDLQQILHESQENVQQCAQEVEQAKLTVEKTAEQLSSIKEARVASEEKAAAAASEENDARLAAEMTQKMLDDAAMVHSIANKETARVLEKAGVALQETIRTANVHYQKKIKQREEIDIATVRLFATEKAVDYAVARANTAVENRLRDKLLAEKLAEVKTAEVDVVGWMRRIAEVQKEKEAARFDKVMAQLESSLKEAEQRAEQSLVSEEEEKKSAAIYIVEQKATGEADIEALEEKKRGKLQEKQNKTEELLFAQADAKTTQEASNVSDTAATMLAAEAEAAINQGKADQEAALKKLEQHIQSVRDDVERKKEAHKQAGEALNKITARIGSIGELIEQLQQQAVQAEAEEQAAREAAETARKLADNAVKVRLSISSESANLLMQAQQVLAESAKNAEDTVVKQQQYRVEIEQQYQQALVDQAEGETAVRNAEHVLAEAKDEWDKEEERLAREIEAGEKSKSAWSQAFDQKIKDYENKLMEAQDQAEQLRLNAAEAQKKVAIIEQEIETLDAAIYAFEPAKDELIRKTDQLCEDYLAASQERLNQIYAIRQTANEEAALYRQTLGEATEAIASMENKEAELRAKLEVSRAHVERIIEVAKDQLLAADAQVNLRRAEKEACNKALGEVAEYLESINIKIPAMDTDTQTLLETAVREAMPEAGLAAMGTEAAESEILPLQEAAKEPEEPLVAEQPVEVEAELVADAEDNGDAETAVPQDELAPSAELTMPEPAVETPDIEPEFMATEAAALEPEQATEPLAAETEAEPDLATDANTAQDFPLKQADQIDGAEAAATMPTEDIVFAEAEPVGDAAQAEKEAATTAAAMPTETQVGDTAAESATTAKQPEHDLYAEAVQAQRTIELEATRLLEELAALSAAGGGENAIAETVPEPQTPVAEAEPEGEVAKQELASGGGVKVDTAESPLAETEDAGDPAAVAADRARTAEEEEEAAILADLSGSIPGVDKDEAAEFTAWLNLIDGDIINKMMQDDHPRHKTPPSEVNLDDWMANLEKTMNEEETIAKQMLAQKMEAEQKQAVAAGEGDYHFPEEKDGEKNAAPAKKSKKSFRFF